MRNALALFAAPLFVATVSTAARADETQPMLVTAPIDKVFVPLGFDDNDNAEIVLHGEFPNTCYKVGTATATVDPVAHKISIDAQSWFYRGAGCAQLMVPFIQPVKLGLVPAGDYTISVVNRPDASSTPLNVVVAQSRDPDDFLYAPVDSVSMDRNAAGERTIVVEGRWPLMFVGCMKMAEVRERVTPGQVIVIQPIAQIFQDDADCADQVTTKKFRVEHVITDATERAEYLAHVRVLAGQSVNRLFDLRE